MVCFAPFYTSETYRVWAADKVAEATRLNAPPYGGLYVGQPDQAKGAIARWLAGHPEPKATLAQVADHIKHVAGVDQVGIGFDFYGTGGIVTVGLEVVSRHLQLLAELIHRGWSDADLANLAGNNVLRVMEAAEKVAVEMRHRTKSPD